MTDDQLEPHPYPRLMVAAVVGLCVFTAAASWLVMLAVEALTRP